MAKGNVDVRTMQASGMSRLRFYDVAPEQLETIQLALEVVRRESGAAHDTVALERICMSYLNTPSGSSSGT